VSLIYEALKRAEDERARGAVAVRAGDRRTLFDRRPHWWMWVLMGVLGASVVVLATLVVTGGDRLPGAPTAGTERREASVIAKPASGATPPPPAPHVEPARGAEPAERPAPAMPVAPATRAEPAAPRSDRQPPASASPRKAEAPADQDALARRPPVTAEKVLAKPEKAAAPAQPARAVEPPKITLQVIVYSDVPSQRMVFIEGRRYAEGDAIDSETVLERIDADGAVVKRRGVRFVIAARRG
jgi:hypothetical protein